MYILFSLWTQLQSLQTELSCCFFFFLLVAFSLCCSSWISRIDCGPPSHLGIMCRRDFPAACRWRSSSIYHSKAESNTFEETGRSKPQRLLYKAESEIPVRPCLCKRNNYSANFISVQCVAITTNLSWRRKRWLTSKAVGLYRLGCNYFIVVHFFCQTCF